METATVEIVYGEVELSYEMPRVFEALSEELGVSQIDLAGKLMISGLEILSPLEWGTIARLDAPAHRVFGDNPSGPAGSPKDCMPWNISAKVWQQYLDWCSRNPVNIPGIVASTFKSSLAIAVEAQGPHFIDQLAIKSYSDIARRIDTDLFWAQHGGMGCVDNDQHGTFGGGCLDRGPNW